MKSLNTLSISAITVALALAMPMAYATDGATLRAPKMSGVAQASQKIDRFIITYRDGSVERTNQKAALQNVEVAVTRAGLDRASMATNGAAIAPLSVSYKRKLAVGSDLVRTSRKLNQSEANALMLQISADPAVLHVEADTMLHIVRDVAAPKNADTQTFTPNDPNYADYQWHFSNAIGGANINNAWDVADGSGITIAVIDTGITKHADLDTSLGDDGYDFISDSLVSGRSTDDRAPGGWDLGDWTTTEPYLSACTDASDPPEASSWHGTHVSGTAAELTNNGIGLAGIAYNAKVLPVRVLGHCGGYNSDIADGIVWASGGHVDGVPDNTHPAQVISMSLGGGGVCSASDATGMAVAEALSRGTTVVVAAGNSSSDVANFTPASCPGVITVASNGITGKRAFYSNYGTGVTVSAPGGGIYQNDASSGTQASPDGFVWSAINAGETTPTTDAYGGYAGTSQATPHVSGTVAMILSATKAAGVATPTPAEIKTLLTKSARAFPVNEDQPIGAGIVDAYAAVKLALGGDAGPDPGESAVALAKGVIVTKQSVGYNGDILYSIDVPAGATTLNIRSFGGSGDASLYVKAGSPPAKDGSGADFTSAKPANNEAVVIQRPQAATYYIRLAAKKSDSLVYNFSDVSVMANYNN